MCNVVFHPILILGKEPLMSYASDDSFSFLNDKNHNDSSNGRKNSPGWGRKSLRFGSASKNPDIDNQFVQPNDKNTSVNSLQVV